MVSRVPAGEPFQYFQPQPTALFRMELHGKEIFIPQRYAKVTAVIGDGVNILLICRVRVKRMHKIKLVALFNAVQQGMWLYDFNLIPAHVGNL